MKHWAGLSALLLLLAACAPTRVTPALPPAGVGPGVLVVRDAGGAILLNTEIPLPAPPGATVRFQRYLGSASQSRFSSPQSFDALLAWLKGALKAAGWRLRELRSVEKPPDFFQATLVIEKAGALRQVVLRREAGVFGLEVKP